LESSKEAIELQKNSPKWRVCDASDDWTSFPKAPLRLIAAIQNLGGGHGTYRKSNKLFWIGKLGHDINWFLNSSEMMLNHPYPGFSNGQKILSWSSCAIEHHQGLARRERSS
jgi:hypothetical protein